MTAINVIRQSEAVHILSDGALCDFKTGKLLAPFSKVFPILHLDAAIAARGSPIFGPAFALHAAIDAISFDHLICIASEIAAKAMLDVKGAGQIAAGLEFDLVIAGWSELKGPSSYFMCNHDLHGTARMATVELGEISLLPQTEAMKADLTREFPQGRRADDFDPIVDGLRVLEIQRRFAPRFPIGAFAQLTSITTGSISTKIIRRWPDLSGEIISACA